MKRKYYTAPSAELIMLMPAEELAFTWKWGTLEGSSTASVAGNVTIFDDSDSKSWIYNGSDKPY